MSATARLDAAKTDKRGFKTKRDAERFANGVEVAKLRGEYVAPTLGKVTVGELGPAWLDRQRGHVKPASYRGLRVGLADTRSATLGGCPDSGDTSFRPERRGSPTLPTGGVRLPCAWPIGCWRRFWPTLCGIGCWPPARPAASSCPSGHRHRHVYLSAAPARRGWPMKSGAVSIVWCCCSGTVGLRWGEAAALRVSDVDFLRRRVSAAP